MRGLIFRVAICAVVLNMAAAGGGFAALAQADGPLTRIAFGSCADQNEPQPIWDSVLGYRPELFIFAGDNVYGDVTSDRLAELKDAYARAAALDGYARLRRSVPVLATWDDHDYGRNDAGGDFPYKRQAQALFADFWELPPDDPRRTREGVHHARVFGPPGMRVQAILLDTRYFRSALKPTDARNAPGKERYLPDADPAKTLLGEAQWQWLRSQLQEPAELRLIVSSIQVLADGHGWERWGNLPLERRRLFDLIAETDAGGVIFLSGDRHIGGLYRQAQGVPYPLHEITSSGINKVYSQAREAGPNRIGAIYGAANFGTIDIDWWAGEVALSIRDMSGAAKRRVVIKLSELKTRR